MANAGFEVVHSERFSRAGAAGWSLAGHLLRRRRLSPGELVWCDRLWPLARALDCILPVPGLSLIMVGRKAKTV
jgi:hypothetical protein